MEDDKNIDFGFADIPKEEKTERVSNIFDKVHTKYDIMNDAMSFGVHRLWKKYFVGLAKIKPNDTVCDLASGSCDIALLIANKLTNDGSITISDINDSMLTLGYHKMIDAGYMQKTRKVVANAEKLPFADNSFDIVTMSFGLRNVTDKKCALQEMYRIVKPGGTVLVMEFSKPRSTLIKKIYDNYSFKVIPKLGEKIVKDEESYRYLVESIRRHPNQETLLSWFYQVGFEKCDVTNIHTGVVAIHRGVKY